MFNLLMINKVAVFGAGCFWGVEYVFKKAPGVIKTQVGYMGGKTNNPSYRDVCSGLTKHAEVIKISYDPHVITYKKLLELFFKCHDPTTLNQQGPDYGDQYRSVIFYGNEEERKEANDYKVKYQKDIKKEVVTEIVKAQEFFRAEEYHQDYYGKKDGQPYCHIMPKIKF